MNAPDVIAVAATVQGGQDVVFGSESVPATVAGVTANYLSMYNLTDFQVGDGLTQDDLDTRARVTVLGATAATDLFGSEYPLGKSIKINGASYEVVGVLSEQGQTLAGNPDATIYMPLTTAHSRLYTDRTRRGDHAVSTIVAQAASDERVTAAAGQVTAVLRQEHDLADDAEADFNVLSQDSLLDTVGVITGTLTGLNVQLQAMDTLLDHDPAGVRQQLHAAQHTVRQGIQESRRAIQALRATPLEDLGLTEALRQLCQQQAERTGIVFTCDIAEVTALDPLTEQAVYRIAEAALANVEQHAAATAVTIWLTPSSEFPSLHLHIHDNGIGFEASQVAGDRYGLSVMTERAQLIGATLRIQSAPGQGTRISLEVP